LFFLEFAMSHILQSVAWWGFVPGVLSPDQFVRAVADAGYDGIDLVPEEQWPLVTSHGLAIASSDGHASITLGLNRYDQHARIEAEIRQRLRLAQEWGIPNLICFSGNREGIDDATGIEITAAGLRRVAPAAEAAGVTLVLELLNSKVDHPDYQADRTRWGLQVCQQVNSPRVKLLYDVYHMQIMEGDIIRTLQSFHPLIGHYHDAGCPGRHEPDDGQEIHYPAVWRAIAATGYDGYIAHEFLPRGDAVEALRTTYQR
jgi:hydroxypyruvate isomerase